jgi:hypothetical protein
VNVDNDLSRRAIHLLSRYAPNDCGDELTLSTSITTGAWNNVLRQEEKKREVGILGFQLLSSRADTCDGRTRQGLFPS